MLEKSQVRIPSPSGKSGKIILLFSSQGKVREFEKIPQIREKSGNFDSLLYFVTYIKTTYPLDDWLWWFYSVASVTVVQVAVVHDLNKASNFKHDCVKSQKGVAPFASRAASPFTP